MVEGQIHIADPIIKAALESVPDPEVPVLTVLDLGVVRSVELKGKIVHIDLTPTYSGCPAMDTMAVDIIQPGQQTGFLRMEGEN